MSQQPDHTIEPLEADETVPPRPEEEVADAAREGTEPGTPPPGG
jgi:hypothetical protein